MKTPIRTTLCALALAASLRATLASDNPGSSAPRTSGHVLIFQNETTIEGDIELLGGQYRVRRAAGGERNVLPEEVLKLCKDREEAFYFLRQRANLRDPDERLRLARWCHKNALKKQELEEVAAAVALRPDDMEMVHLYQNLQRMMLSAAEASQTPKMPSPQMPVVIPASVNTDSLGLFVTKVQPILMNTCASCHATGRGGSFQLIRVFQKSGSSQTLTRSNLAATIAQVKSDRPAASPLLVKSVSVHGSMAQPALKSIDSAAYRTLEEWVTITLQAGPVSSQQEIGSSVFSTKTNEASTKTTEETQPIVPVAVPLTGGEVIKTPPVPKGPTDQYDPEIFNRQVHPQGKPTGPNQ
jgi:hypothetical protein